MGAIIFATFVGVPILEIALFIEVGSKIGLGLTVSIVFITAIIGTTLIRHQGLATLKKAQASIQENKLPINEAFIGLCIVVAGLLLLTPGFFTDVVGLSLFVSPVRLLLKRLIGRFIIKSSHFNNYPGHNTSDFKKTTGSIIEGEFEDITADSQDINSSNKKLSQERSTKID